MWRKGPFRILFSGHKAVITNYSRIRNFPSGPGVDSILPMQGAQVESLVREVRFRMLQDVAKKKKRTVRCANV